MVLIIGLTGLRAYVFHLTARQLDVLIETVMNETSCHCSADVCSQPSPPGYRIGVALLKKIKLPEGHGAE